MITATEILTAWINADPQTTDIDRLVGMSAYMAKKLEQDMLKPIEQLEAEVWPQAEPDDSDEALETLSLMSRFETTQGEQA